MIWLLIAVLTLAALAPVALALLRPPAARGRREADLALYRQQLAELDAELAAGRMDAPSHAAAKLEVQRRLLAAPQAGAAGRPAAPASWRSPRVLASLLAVPVLAFGLYLTTGTPDMPSAPYAERRQMMEREREVAQRDEELLAQLRARLAQLDPGTDQARQGWMLLGNAERSRGHLDAAAVAYSKALEARFDADAAAQLAQVLLEADRSEEAVQLLASALPQAPQHLGLRFLSGLAELRAGRPEKARETWQALVADAPEGAPWKAMVQRRLDQLQQGDAARP